MRLLQRADHLPASLLLVADRAQVEAEEEAVCRLRDLDLAQGNRHSGGGDHQVGLDDRGRVDGEAEVEDPGPEVPPSVSNSLDFLFTAESMAGDFEMRLARWFELQAELGPALDLHLAAKYRPSMHLENRFLNAANATEAYHRRRYPISPDVRDAHANRVQRISDAIPTDSAWLRWRLKYALEPSLAERIGDLLERTKEVLGGWLNDPGAFASSVSRARNRLVHQDPDDELPGPDGRSMVDMTEDLALVFMTCVLLDLQFDAATTRSMLERTRRWQFLKFRKHGWSA